MTDVVVLVPYRSDGGRRDELWEFTLDWLMKHHTHHEWAVITGESPEGPFNRGAAINDAARKAGDWDVAVVHDADNIADPIMLGQAVRRAHETKGCVFPFSYYVYLDEFSTNRLMTSDNWFVAPQDVSWGVTREHCSGIQAISRTAYDQVGGFLELEGWGYEDWITSVLLKTFTSGVEHLQGSAYHLYHGGDHRTTTHRPIMADVMALSVVPDQLREYLLAGGHPIP